MIVRASQGVAAVLTLFGSVFLEIAPPLPSSTGCPEGGERLNAAVASFIVLAMFFLIVGAARLHQGRMERRMWLRMSGVLLLSAVPLAIAYLVIHGLVIVEATTENHVLTGLWTSAHGTAEAVEWGVIGRFRLLQYFGCDGFQEPWPYVSIVASYVVLMTLYVATLLCVFGSLFCVSEGIFESFRKGR